MGFEKELGAVKVIKDQIQYRSHDQSLLNLARGYFSYIDIPDGRKYTYAEISVY